jgi:YggT family protein
MSWISPNGEDNISQFLDQITEPILAPIRKIVPPLGMFDLTPMIALIVLQMVRPHIVNLVHGGF